MGQITTETIAMIRRAVDANQAPPLTLWEFRQLAFLAEKQITKASPLTYVQRRSLIDRAGDLTDGLNQDDFADEIVKLVEAHHGVATQQEAQPQAELTTTQLASACMYFRHDFGLLPDNVQKQMIVEAKYWDQALRKERAFAAREAQQATDKKGGV